MTLVVYSKANCPQCVTLKKRLEAASIEFQEVRTDLDETQRQFLLSKGHRALPVVYKDGVHVTNVNSLF